MSKIVLKQGDCLDIMKEIADKSIDLILCDLPYGTLKSKKCKWDEVIPFDELWKNYRRIIKDNGAILLFGIEPFSSKLRLSNSEMYRYDLYWHKTLCSNFMMGKVQPFFKIENISVFYSKSPTYNPQMIEGKPYKVLESHIEQQGMQQKYCFSYKTDVINDGTRYPDNLLEFGSLGGKKLHPTQKPIDLLEWLIKTYTNKGDLVLDNCMGSGSTAIATLNTNRNFIGYELSEEYYYIILKRLNEYEKGN